MFSYRGELLFLLGFSVRFEFFRRYIWVPKRSRNVSSASRLNSLFCGRTPAAFPIRREFSYFLGFPSNMLHLFKGHFLKYCPGLPGSSFISDMLRERYVAFLIYRGWTSIAAVSYIGISYLVSCVV